MKKKQLNSLLCHGATQLWNFFVTERANQAEVDKVQYSFGICQNFKSIISQSQKLHLYLLLSNFSPQFLDNYLDLNYLGFFLQTFIMLILIVAKRPCYFQEIQPQTHYCSKFTDKGFLVLFLITNEKHTSQMKHVKTPILKSFANNSSIKHILKKVFLHIF